MKVNSVISDLCGANNIKISLMLLIVIGIIVYFLMESEIHEYIRIRNDYTIYKELNLNGVCSIVYSQNGYIISLEIYAADISNNTISDINRLKNLNELRVFTKNGLTGHENVTNLSLIKKLYNIDTIHIGVGDLPPIQFLDLPPTIKTIYLHGGTGLDNEELMKLKHFTHIKSIFIAAKTITDKDIDEFHKIRPDVSIEIIMYGYE
jgi:hypothetical protein